MKRIIFLETGSCEPCEKALPKILDILDEVDLGITIIDIASDENVKYLKEKYRNVDIATVDGIFVAPTVCLVDDKEVKKCVIGYSSDYDDRIKELLSELDDRKRKEKERYR